MDRRFARKILLGAWLLLALLTPWSVQARPPAPVVQAPELAPQAAPSCILVQGIASCFVIGDDRQIWKTPGDVSWGTWALVGGIPGAAIDRAGGVSAVSRGAQYDIFVIGSSGLAFDLYRRTWNGSGWLPWENLGHPGDASVFEVSCASLSATNMECFARVFGNHLWQRSWNGVAWGAWTDLGEFPSSDPFGGLAATTYGGGSLLIYATGSDGHAYRRYYAAGSWVGWFDDGAPAGASLRQVGCSMLNPTVIDCAFIDGAGKAWHRRWSNSSAWTDFIDMGAPPSGARGVTVTNYGEDGIIMLTNTNDGQMYWRFRPTGENWVGWSTLGRPRDIRLFIPHVIR